MTKTRKKAANVLVVSTKLVNVMKIIAVSIRMIDYAFISFSAIQIHTYILYCTSLMGLFRNNTIYKVIIYNY